MTVPASIVTGAGLRTAFIYELDDSNRIKATSTTFVAGTEIQGAKVLTQNVPQARRVGHAGNDRFLGYTILPPNEGATAELRTGKKNIALDAQIKGQLVTTVGESKFGGEGTDRDGLEIPVCVLAYQAAEDADDASAALGADRWASTLIPKARLYPRAGSFDDNAYESAYDVVPFRVSKFPWGLAYTQLAQQYLNAMIHPGIHVGKPRLLAALGDGTEDAFPFPAGIVAYDTAKVAVFIDGVARTTNVTITTAGITFTVTMPALNAHVDVVLETL